MGSILKAKCECGFKTKFPGGAGKVDFNEKCNFPAICENCKEFVVINYLAKYHRCPKCRKKVKFY